MKLVRMSANIMRKLKSRVGIRSNLVSKQNKHCQFNSFFLCHFEVSHKACNLILISLTNPDCGIQIVLKIQSQQIIIGSGIDCINNYQNYQNFQLFNCLLLRGAIVHCVTLEKISSSGKFVWYFERAAWEIIREIRGPNVFGLPTLFKETLDLRSEHATFIWHCVCEIKYSRHILCARHLYGSGESLDYNKVNRVHKSKDT